MNPCASVNPSAQTPVRHVSGWVFWGMVSIALAGASGCAQGVTLPQSEGLAPGVHEVRVVHEGRLRSARVFVPARGASPGPQPGQENGFPLVLAFHGGGGRASSFAASNGLEAVAEREGFVVVHPDGTGPAGLHTWNAGAFCCGSARDENVDDVGFVRALVAELAARFAMAQIPLDLKRIYATGHSNGAMITYRIAEETGTRLLAAIVPVAGARAPDAADALEAIPLLHIHSIDDPRALYHGGTGPPFPLTNHRVDHPAVPATLAAWRSANGCDAGEGEQVALRVGRAPLPSGGEQRAELVRWAGCASGAPVYHWRLEGVGHGWPGHELRRLRQEVTGPSTTLIDAADEIWDFMRRWSRG